MGGSYYREKLSGERLRQVYEAASPRVKQYLDAEVDFLLGRLRATDAVLELGCGYGRVLLKLLAAARRIVGIDTAPESLELGRRMVGDIPGCEFIEMDALDLGFNDGEFDVVACIQNGICAFGVDRERLVREALRVTRAGGRVMVSTYSERFWAHRLEWFEAQAQRGLLGEIDYEQTGGGAIVCRDGFRAGMLTPDELRALAVLFGITPTITEVDGSSVFCELMVPRR